MDTHLFYLLNIFFRASQIFLEILPYLIVGIIIGEALKYKKLHNLVEKFRSRNLFLSTLIASVLGMISPLCTYGTVPVVMRLNSSGVPISILIVFLTSSSMMNPQLFIMTWGGIGLEMALMMVLYILVFSLLMGWILRIIPEIWILNKKCLEDFSKNLYHKNCSNDIFTWRNYLVHILKSLEHIGFYVVIGVILAAAIEILIPANIANTLFQQDKLIQMLVMAVLSIPLYTCGGGAIPAVGSLISGGMSKGAALAFLNVGSATRITTLSALAAIVRPLFIVVYVIILITFSVIMGCFYK